MAKLKYKLNKLIAQGNRGIFLVEFENNYDLAMTFLRYQEFYESPNSKFRGKSFTILDYMEWYSKDRDGHFSYPSDWSGFNIPDHVIEQNRKTIIDFNKYDECMFSIQSKIHKHNYEKFYLIGALENDHHTRAHEVAHGLYYINDEYKKSMNNLIKSYLSVKEKNKIEEELNNLGYSRVVFKDEMQAYLSTGNEYFTPVLRQPFVDVLSKYYKQSDDYLLVSEL